MSSDKDDKNENDKTLMSSNKDDQNENDNEIENGDDDETMSQNEKDFIIKELYDILDEIIDKSKSFEDQIKLPKKREDLKGFWPYSDYGDKEF